MQARVQRGTVLADNTSWKQKRKNNDAEVHKISVEYSQTSLRGEWL